MSHDIHIARVNITDDAPGNAHFNTDGIDPNSCTNVLIEDYYYCGGGKYLSRLKLRPSPRLMEGTLWSLGCSLRPPPSVADDAIAIKSGWNIAGILYGRPSKNITVRRSTSGCRGGWTIGSEASAGVEDVLFEDLVSTSESGIRVSAELQRGGIVRNVTFRNLTFAWQSLEKKTFLFNIGQTYPNGGTNPPCNGCPIPPLTPKQTIPLFQGITFEDITVLSAPKGLSIGSIDCSISPCHAVTMNNLKLFNTPSPKGLSCTNVHGHQTDNDPSAIGPGCITEA